MLAVRSARFVRGSRAIFDDVGFDHVAGDILCVLGPNGIGKTTLLRCLAGLDRLSSGSVRLDGTDLADLSRRRIGQQIGFVPQSDSTVFGFTARQMVEMGRASHLGLLSVPGSTDRAIAYDALERVGAIAFADRSYPELSGGERQLVQIARSLAQQPRLLILDEPTAHLDFANQARLFDILRSLAQQGLAVVLTTHDPGHAFQIGTAALLMAPGRRAVFGRTTDVLTEASLATAYGRAVQLRTVGDRTVCLT